MGSADTRFQLMVLYEWKAGIGPERIAYHAAKIRALAGKVPNLCEARFGPRLLGHPDADARRWHHAAVLVFKGQGDYAAFGPTPAHDEVAIELITDLERISYVGFEG
jgi:hypothetical protein